MQVYKNCIVILIVCAGLFSCKKEEITKKSVTTIDERELEYVYGVNDVNISQEGINKPNVKSTIEFISIAYSDLFGQTIDQNNLTGLALAYVAFADKKMIEDMIVRTFLANQNLVLPSKSQMDADVKLFVTDTYKKFYNREPNEFELWQIEELIIKDNAMTPELVYYSFMTSNEYRYY